MSEKEYCKCSAENQKSKFVFGRKSFTCGTCNLSINDSFSESAVNQSELKINLDSNSFPKIDYRQLGIESAKRVFKYGTLFEKIAEFLQVFNTIVSVFLFLAGFFLTELGSLKLIYWVAILLLWFFGYLQVALVRGITSYFQMKACNYLEVAN